MSVRAALSNFYVKKIPPLITKHIYPIKIRWVIRQESPPSTKWSQLSSWLAKESLAREWETLTESHSENKNMGRISDKLWRCQGGIFGGALAMAAPGDGHVRGWFGACPRNNLERAGWNHHRGCEVENKRQLIPCEKGLYFQIIVRNAIKFSGKTVRRDLFCLEVGENQNLQSKRKDPPPQKSDSTTEENFLFQVPAFQRMTNQDHCSKSIVACLGVTFLAWNST